MRINGYPDSLRLVSIDTEEVFDGDRDRKFANDDFASYWKKRGKTSGLPRQVATPFGETANGGPKNILLAFGKSPWNITIQYNTRSLQATPNLPLGS